MYISILCLFIYVYYKIYYVFIKLYIVSYDLILYDIFWII